MDSARRAKEEKHKPAANKPYNGGQLFLLFVKQRLKDDNPELNCQLSLLSALQPEENVEFESVYKGLEEISIQFQSSNHRQLTREEALAHSLDVREEEFKSIVQQVVSAATQNLAEHIIVVFFFMYDFMMRMHGKGVPRMEEVLDWSQMAVVEGVDPQVAQAGGWAQIFRKKKQKQKQKLQSSIRPKSRFCFWK